MEFQVIKYLEYLESNIDAQISRKDLSEMIKTDLEGKSDVIKDLKERFRFQLKSRTEKQATRMQWLAARRKRGSPILIKQNTINLYSKIIEALAYLSFLNRNDVYSDLVNLCKDELELIDFSGRNFGDRHVSEKKMHDLFTDLLNKESNTMEELYPEAYEKLRELYEEFIKVYTDSQATQNMFKK